MTASEVSAQQYFTGISTSHRDLPSRWILSSLVAESYPVVYKLFVTDATQVVVNIIIVCFFDAKFDPGLGYFHWHLPEARPLVKRMLQRNQTPTNIGSVYSSGNCCDFVKKIVLAICNM